MLTNRNHKTIFKKNIEKRNYTPPKLKGEGGVECPMCGFIVEHSTMVKQKKTGNLVCGICWDGDQPEPIR